MATTDRSNLQKTKRFIIQNLNSEVMRDAYLQGIKYDPEFSDEDYEQEKIIVELSREYHGHPDPVDIPEKPRKRIDTESGDEFLVPA